jgi:glycerate-2-kinase
VVIDGTGVPLGPDGRVFLLAAGKAAATMAETALEQIGPLVAGGLVVYRDPATAVRLPLPVLQAGHPLPDGNSIRAGERCLRLAGEAGPGDLVILLVSGGCSSLLEVPAGRLTLDDLRRTNALLLRCGADISAINTVRTHLSRIKGGRLARAAAPARFASLLLSDVVGDDPAVIGSGPGVPHAGTFDQALAAVDAFGMRRSLPPAVLQHLLDGAAGAVEASPKPENPWFEKRLVRVIGGNRDALSGAAEEASDLGYRVSVSSDPVVGEARHAAGLVVGRLGAPLLKDGPAACRISGGETTVTLAADHGTGGRNMELALAAVPLLAGRPGSLLLSAGTDGSDGPTAAAGAVADHTTLSRAEMLGLDFRRCLDRHDAHAFFRELGDLVDTGATGTNVGDLQVLLRRTAADK